VITLNLIFFWVSSEIIWLQLNHCTLPLSYHKGKLMMRLFMLMQSFQGQKMQKLFFLIVDVSHQYTLSHTHACECECGCVCIITMYAYICILHTHMRVSMRVRVCVCVVHV
jgi:hypothetical protein